jgi:hypothetical protein
MVSRCEMGCQFSDNNNNSVFNNLIYIPKKNIVHAKTLILLVSIFHGVRHFPDINFPVRVFCLVCLQNNRTLTIIDKKKQTVPR